MNKTFILILKNLNFIASDFSFYKKEINYYRIRDADSEQSIPLRNLCYLYYNTNFYKTFNNCPPDSIINTIIIFFI